MRGSSRPLTRWKSREVHAVRVLEGVTHGIRIASREAGEPPVPPGGGLHRDEDVRIGLVHDSEEGGGLPVLLEDVRD